MKTKRIISLVVSAIISAAILASCAVMPKAPTPTGIDVTTRITVTPEDGRGAGGAEDTAGLTLYYAKLIIKEVNK